MSLVLAAAMEETTRPHLVLPMAKASKRSKPKPEFQWETTINNEGRKVLLFDRMIVSDLHLGTPHSRAKWTFHMLTHTQSHLPRLCVGDKFDLTYMQSRIRQGDSRKIWKNEDFFGEFHGQVIAQGLRSGDMDGIGNHEAAHKGVLRADGEIEARAAWASREIFGGRRNVFEEMFYEDPKGRVFLVTHADRFDDVVFGNSKELWYERGSLWHTRLAAIDGFVQQLPGCEHVSFADGGKWLVKKYINACQGVQGEIAREIDANPKLHGIIHGHSHDAGIWMTEAGKLILNSGHCTGGAVTMLAHDINGTWASITWTDKLHVLEENGCRYEVSFKKAGIQPSAFPGTKSFSRSKISDEFTQQAEDIMSRVLGLAQADRGVVLPAGRSGRMHAEAANAPVHIYTPS